jgi:hypothetical protein
VTDNYDPTPDRRIYYTHARTGDRGYLVRRYGTDHIKYDRVGPDQTIPFRPEDWREELGRRAFQEHEVTRVAFAADKELCRALGRVREANRQWLDLSDADRISWVTSGPPVRPHHLRAKLYRAIVEVMKSDGATSPEATA